MVRVHPPRRRSQPEKMENFNRAVLIPRLPSFHLHPAHPYALLQQQEETLMTPSRSSPENMENFMGVLFIPKLTIVHLHPASAYRPLYQQQEENIIYRENMPTRFTWTFPGSANVLKLNTDGSSKGNPGPSSFGGLIRDYRGRWLCGYMGKMKERSYTSLEAEIWSIYKGLCLVKKMNLSNVLIETDCQAAMVLRAGELDNDDPIKSVVEAMEAIMIEKKCTKIHTRRDGNHCADLLAKLGANQSEEYHVLEEPPAQLLPYLSRDNEAAYEFERNH